MRVIPEDHLRNFLRKPFRDKPAQKALRSLSVDDTCPRSRPISLSEPSRSLRRKPLEISVETPFRTILREVPPVPEASPEAISPKASFDTPSKQTLRFFLRNMPRVPKVKPKDPFRNMPYVPEALPGATFRSLRRNPAGPSFGKCHLSRVPESEASPPGFFPSHHVSPNAPSGNSLPEAAECATCPARIFHPDAARQPRESPRKTPPGTRRMHHVSRQPFFPTKFQKNPRKCIEL